MSAFDVEKEALLLDRSAIIRVVGALRRYRAAAADLLAKRYSDGECDGLSLLAFEAACADIEEDLQ